MTSRRTRLRIREAAERLQAGTVLFGGTAKALLADLEADARDSGLRVVTTGDESAGREPAQTVILAIDGSGRRSALAAGIALMDTLAPLVASDAVRILVIQQDRSQHIPSRLKKRLVAEILFQVTLALLSPLRESSDRSWRQRTGLAALDAAGLRIRRLAY